MSKVSIGATKRRGGSYRSGRQGAGPAVRFLLRGGRTAMGWCVGLALLLPAACSIGTGEVELSLSPKEVTYTGLTEWVRTGFQVYGKRLDNEHPAEGFEVSIAASFAGEDCAGPLYNQYFALEDARGNPVNCPWRTRTGSDGQVRFNVRFLGSAQCFLWRYTVSVFGEEGTYESASVQNCCEEIDPVTGDRTVVCPAAGG